MTPRPEGHRSLPLGQSTLVGRDADLLQVTEMLGHGRLVTLFGPGGVGKTRLAREIVARVESDGGRVAVIHLAEASQPEQFLSALTNELGVVPIGKGSLAEILRETARDLASTAPLVLFLDEFDRLVEHTSELVGALLTGGGPDLKILVTSREILRHPLEQAYELLPLALPSGEGSDAMVGAACQLLIERARRYRRAFPEGAEETTAALDLVRRLDGMPLPIEIVAPRVALLGAISVRNSLRDSMASPGSRPGGIDRRSVHRVIESSWALLSGEEQRAIAQCTVFRGSFTTDAFEEVVDRPPGW